jgi:hypothetical protein
MVSMNQNTVLQSARNIRIEFQFIRSNRHTFPMGVSDDMGGDFAVIGGEVIPPFKMK